MAHHRSQIGGGGLCLLDSQRLPQCQHSNQTAVANAAQRAILVAAVVLFGVPEQFTAVLILRISQSVVIGILQQFTLIHWQATR